MSKEKHSKKSEKIVTLEPLPPHARLSPSASEKWIQCGFSASEPDLDDERTNDAAREGDKIHARVEDVLKNDLDLEPFEPASFYVQYVRDLMREYPDARFVFERKFHSHIIPDFFGSIDVLLVSPEFLYVIDIKTGKWRVTADWNSQLRCYMWLAMESYGMRPLFKGTILQNGKSSHCKVSPQGLLEFGELVKTQSTSLEQVMGPWCTFCHMKKKCDKYLADVEAMKAAVWGD